MRHGMTWAALLLCGLTARLGAQPAEEAEKPESRFQPLIVSLKGKLGPDFTVKQVGMFVVALDLDKQAGAQYENLITQIEQALYENFFVNRPEYVIKIVLFKDNASLQKSAKKVAEKSLVMPGGGFYLPYEKVLCVETPMGPWVLKHELTHALLHADFRREKLCPWVDEGMAMLVESATLDGKQIQLRLDGRIQMVYQLMKAQKLPHLKDVFSMDFATYNSMANRMIGDAMSRNLLFYLHEKGLLIPFYKRFRGNYGRDRTGIKFIEEIAKKDINAVETDWLAWVNDKTAKHAAGEAGKAPAEPDQPAP